MSRLIVGSIVGNEVDNYLTEWLDDVKTYADFHCIVDDASTDGTQQVLEEYAEDNKGKVNLVRGSESIFKTNETQLRTELWNRIRKVAKEGDWILIVDADEFYSYVNEEFKEVMKTEKDVVAIRLLDMWENGKYRVDGYWSPYFHRLFRYKDKDFVCLKTGLHQSPLPKYVIETNDVFVSDIRCFHYSYLRDSDKKKKYDFYMENVPQGFNRNHARSIMEVKPELKDTIKELPSILITSLIHNREWVLPYFLRCLDNMDYPKDKINYTFIVNNNTDKSVEILKEWNSEALIVEHNFENKNSGEHKWSAELIYHMALMRNKTLLIAKNACVDYMVNIDSDILFPKNTLKHLLTTDKKIISPVFFAGWNSPKKLPQVWDKGGYDLSESLLGFLTHRKGIIRVGGLGAFTCIHKDVWEKGVNYSRVYNLPNDMFGEDRDFCTRASVHNFMLFADNYLDLVHIDNKEMLSDLIYNKKNYKEVLFFEDK